MAEKKKKEPLKKINRRGRKTITYENSVKPHLELIVKLRQEGYDEKDIYAALNVSKNKFYEFKREYEELREALKKGLNLQGLEIEKKAFSVAMGGIKVTKTKQQLVNGKMTVVEIVTEETLPNVTMQIFMLKNLLPERYRDKTELNIMPNDDEVIPLEKILIDRHVENKQ